MPARHHVLAIMLFWLATTAWMIQRDFLPRFRQGKAPPFSIDLAYEAQSKASYQTWTIYRGTEKLGVVHTWVAYSKDDDTFELHSGPMQANTAPQINMKVGPLS